VKIAAILVPVTLFLLPTFVHAALVVVHGVRGDDTFASRPLTQGQRRMFFRLAAVYGVVTVVSIGWSIHVFTEEMAYLLLYGLSLVAMVGLVIFMRRDSPIYPKPPPEGFPDEKARLDWENRIHDIMYEHVNKRVLSWKFWAAIFLVYGALMAIGIVVGIMLLD
jgi:hypothetical protein